MSTRRRTVSIVPLPSKATAGMLIADATARFSDARLEIVEGQLVITSTKQAGK